MAKAIREAFGKGVLSRQLQALTSENGVGKGLTFPVQNATVTPETDFGQLAKDNPWLATEVGNVASKVRVQFCSLHFHSNWWGKFVSPQFHSPLSEHIHKS